MSVFSADIRSTGKFRAEGKALGLSAHHTAPLILLILAALLAARVLPAARWILCSGPGTQ